MTKRFDVDIEDLEYARPGGNPLLARLYKPRGAGPFPSVVEVHGGAWTSNDRLTNAPIHQPLAKSGVVVMAIDFRMPPDAQYPESLKDINAAIRWLKRNGDQYGTHAGLVGLLGTSSGGHQAMLSALRPDSPLYQPEVIEDGTNDASVAFVALCWSVLDPLARYRMVEAKGIQRLVDAHHAYWPSVEAMAEGNPQLILERGDSPERSPVLLLQGTKDDNLTPDMADNFAAAYRDAGGKIILEKFEGEPHAFIGKDPTSPASLRAIELIKAFVRDQASGLLGEVDS
jgi:acetyl esterase